MHRSFSGFREVQEERGFGMRSKMPDRRDVLRAAGAAGAALGISSLGIANEEGSSPAIPLGKAEHLISIWLGGGMGQIDSFDPKRRGDAKAKRPGAYYDAIDTVVPGVQVCQHLPSIAGVMDRVTAIRSVHHDTIDEHAAATNRMHTGRPVGGTLVFPSLGSLIAHQRGPASENAAAYVVLGFPNPTRGPGFLGSRAGYLYLTETGQGPAGLSRPDGISLDRQTRRQQFRDQLQLARRTQGSLAAQGLEAQYEEAMKQSERLAGPEFQEGFELDREPSSLREAYGGEFGQRCLLARRLVERGVRFLEVSHNLNFLNGSGWDVHNEGIEQQHRLLAELDQAVGMLIRDLADKGWLDRTLISITTEFGRPPEFDSGGGRGHQGSAFTCVLAGGGLSHCGAYGETDELSKKMVADPVSVPDLFATMLAAMQIDPSGWLQDGDRPVPITDGGRPIAKLFG